MIFQEVLAESDPRVKTLQSLVETKNPKTSLTKHWQSIIDNINYYPIFHIAAEILRELASNRQFVDALKELANTAQNIVNMRAALRHDLMGRVYHRLLIEQKYLATFYTGIPAATLLLLLSLRRSAWNTDWSSLKDIRKLKIADLACGTGTLLVAAADAITDNYISAAAAVGKKIENEKLQKCLVENVIHGYDVLAAAIHLTASTLAMRAPQVTFDKMNLSWLPHGGEDARLGSIEYMIDKNVGMPADLFGTTKSTKRIKGHKVEDVHLAVLPDLDLCVMNPPFTRSVGGNLLFGSLPRKEREKAQKRLKQIVKTRNALASITAGLGAVFVATANDYIVPGGRIALVLPKALLSGVAWAKTRSLLEKYYQVEYIIASQDPLRWNFSESTSLSEVLLVAKKLVVNVPAKPDSRAIAVNLTRNPTTVFEAQAIGHELLQLEVPKVEAGHGSKYLRVGSQIVGEAISIKLKSLKDIGSWMLPCAFAQSDLIRTAYWLESSKLWIPSQGHIGSLPLCHLDELATLGPDARDIHDGFDLVNRETAYPAYWGHNVEQGFALSQKPNAYLAPITAAKPGRPLRKLEDLWPKAGDILIAERMRLNTQGVVAVKMSTRVLSSVWWSINLKETAGTERHRKAMVLWLNSSLFLISLLAHRVETEGAWVKFKKPTLEEMPVLDLRELKRKQIDQLVATFDAITDNCLLSFVEIDHDPIRKQIDDSIATALKIEDFGELRQLLSREPVICLRRL